MTAEETYRVEALTEGHSREGFSCGIEALDRYLHHQARQDAEKRVAAPFVLVGEDREAQVLGYYTLSASIVTVDQLPAATAKRLPRYPQLPVTLLGRLAIDQRVRGRGFGEFLLMDALAKSLDATETIASMAVLVDAKNQAAEDFFRHFGFQPLEGQLRRFFVSMKHIQEMLK